MKQNNQGLLIGTKTTATEVCHWAKALFDLHACLAPHFARKEPHHRALAYLKGILSEISRKNGWQLAEYAGEARPDGMQRLLSSSVWDENGVRDDLRHYALSYLGQESAILAVDETSFPKRGKHSAGVGVQYCGTTGQVQNCQVGGFLSYITDRGHTLIDRELYLPFDWCGDQERRQAAGIPESVCFQTKPELAVQMLERIWKEKLPISWVVADSVYGSNRELRTWLEAHKYAYALAVQSDELVGMQTPLGRKLEKVSLVEYSMVHETDWHCLSMSEGTKGPRLFDWACVPLLHCWQNDECHWLLIRRSIVDPVDKRYYLVFAPPATPPNEMVKAIGARWRIEEEFENAKDLGLDQYEVRSFIGWYRHVTLVLVAVAYLAGICAGSCPLPSPIRARNVFPSSCRTRPNRS